MGDIVNLRRVKRTRARAAAAVLAAENRARAGTSKAERAAESARRALSRARLDGAALTELSQTGTAKDAKERDRSS